MSNISRSVLFGKLNTTLYKTLENAYTFCRLRENSYVELVHWLHSLLQTEKTDIFCLINSFNLDEARVRKDVLTAVEKLPAGSTAVIDFSEHIQTLVEQTWTYSSLKFGTDKIRTAHIFYTMLENKTLQSILANISSEFLKIKPETLANNIIAITANSEENLEVTQNALSSEPNATHKESALAKYGAISLKKPKMAK